MPESAVPFPKPLELARLPTPIQPLPRLSEHLGVEVHAKRDDLTGLELSGNKVRKLDLLLAEALEEGADTVITCGGLQSNHCRATAAACRRLGLDPVLLLRGDVRVEPESNLLIDTLLGAELRACTPDEYRSRRDASMGEIADELRRKGRRPYVIPEGGSNGLGAIGYALAAEELAGQIERPYDAVFVAVGSGGTLAGLALGPDVGPVHGVAVCDDRAYFAARVEQIAAEATAYGLGALPAEGGRWRVVEGYQGPGYALADAAIWRTIALVARMEGLLVDPVYTGKAMHALVSEVEAGRVRGRVLFWHTGGAFGLFGRGRELVGASG